MADRFRVVQIETTGFHPTSKSTSSVIWEGTDLNVLSTRFPKSKVMGADAFSHSEIEGGWIRSDFDFETHSGDGVWVKIEDPRHYVYNARQAAFDREIEEENRRLYPGDYYDETEEVYVDEDEVNENEDDTNHFEQSVDETLSRVQEVLGTWRFDELTIANLRETAPAWPKGADAFRSLRIRWGEGDEGVALTFERHTEAMERVFGEKYFRSELLLSGKAPYLGTDVERLRLLNGNETHKPTVEWIIVPNLSQNYKRKCGITWLRHRNSLADEGLALAWLFPNRVRAIVVWKFSAWICAGYELNIPEKSYLRNWHGVVCVDRDVDSDKVLLNTGCRDGEGGGVSVPSLVTAK